jgi:two-component system, OmpR family, phosphate regulon sensor histidine kinase PhoR
MRQKPGISQVLVGAALLAAVLGGVILLRTLAGALAEAGVAEPAAGRVRGAVTLTVVLLAAGGVVGAALIGRLLTRPFVQLRAAILERARGDDLPPPQSPLAEAAALSGALARLASRVAAHETELQRSAAEVSVLHDAISDGILQLGAGGRIMRANPAARALLRLTQAAIGDPVATHVRNAELRRILERAAAGEPVQAAEVALDDRRVFVSARPLGGLAELTGTGAVVAFTDITELRRLEGVRRDFVANVSHELKTPLTSIRGYVETLLSDELPPDMQRQFLEVVQKNADRLHHIVDDLLDLSRLESGGWRPELHEVNALDVVDDVWSGCAERAARRQVTFLRPVETFAVHADPGGLRQVLSNLLDNALRYTPDRGRIEVRTYLEPQAPGKNGRKGTLNGVAHGFGNGMYAEPESDRAWVVFEVRDTGTGIPSEALPRIFERFYRVDPARSRAEGGTGLGLSIVKHLVESMGGSVSAESELGKGTVIRFRLPAAQ